MVKIAIEGCCHGELKQIYESISDQSVDLLIICGDFQSLRNTSDFKSLNVPPKYQKLGDFNQYYSGALTAPVLTVFIGGNHECSTYLKELKFGGWVCPNIFYLGEFGSIYFKGLKIVGWSGIFNYQSFITAKLNYDDCFKLPLDSSSIRSIYHTNLRNFIKMCLMKNENIDIALSHDWPLGIEKYGNVKNLLSKKPFFKKDISLGKLGSPLNKFLIENLKPRFWFSAHLHVKFNARIRNETYNKDEISLDMDDEEESEIEHNSSKRGKGNDVTERKRVCSDLTTEFIALDKVGKSRHFIEIKNIESSNLAHPSNESNHLYYDSRSILINRIVEEYFNANEDVVKHQIDFHEVVRNPSSLQIVNDLSSKLDLELEQFNYEDENLVIPNDFEVIAPIISQENDETMIYYNNNQTDNYCKTFNIPYISV